MLACGNPGDRLLSSWGAGKHFQNWRYVPYISVGKPREADDSIEPQEGVVLRTRKGELVSITIVGLRGRLGSSSR